MSRQSRVFACTLLCVGAVGSGRASLAHAEPEPLQELLAARAVMTVSRIAPVGRSLSAKTDCDPASASSPGNFERAVFKEGCSAVLARFEGPTSFSLARFDGPVELSSTTFFMTTSFKWAAFNAAADLSHAQFQAAVDFYSATFVGPVDLFNGRFNAPAGFQKVELRDRVDFTGTALREGVSFYQATFQGAVSFRGAELLGEADFSSAQFHGAVDFSRTRFQDKLSLAEAYFGGPVTFSNAHLPATLDLSGLTDINGVIDLTKASPPSGGQKCRVNLVGSDIDKINIDYDRFELFFPPDTSPRDILDVYEGLLSNFKKRGQEKSYRAASIELEQYKYARDDRWLMNEIERHWWDYGFEKERIFVWIGVLISAFTLVNNLFFAWLLENAFQVEFLLPYVRRPPDEENPVIRFVLNLPLALMYTAILFLGSLFGFSREVSHFRSHWLPVNIYLFFIMAAGLVCTMFILNFIVA